MGTSGDYNTSTGELLSRHGFIVKKPIHDDSPRCHDFILDEFGDHRGIVLKYPDKEKLLLVWPLREDQDFIKKAITNNNLRNYCLAHGIRLAEDVSFGNEGLNRTIDSLVYLTANGNSVEQELSWSLLLSKLRVSPNFLGKIEFPPL